MSHRLLRLFVAVALVAGVLPGLMANTTASAQASPDLAWTVSGDPTGLHLLVADARDGYSWRTAATLWEPGFSTDRWVGNACVTGSGRRAVVVYAPRQFTNRPELFDRGAFTAVVDLSSGAVTKLPISVSMAYFNPGCGAGEDAVLTQSGVADLGKTRLHRLDATTGKLTGRVELAGEISSAVPVGDRIVAAGFPGLIEIDARGTRRPLTTTHGVAFGVRADAAGGVVFLEQHGEAAAAKRLHRGKIAELGRGPLTKVQTWAGAGGRVFLAGVRQARPAEHVTTVGAMPGDDVSTQGAVTVAVAAPRVGDAVPDSARPVTLRVTGLVTGARLERVVVPGQSPSPRLSEGRTAGPLLSATTAGSATDPVDADRTCSVPRNDSRTQVYQPHWTQVEWAANLAVQKALTITRPANWKQSGLPSWSPQGMYPPLDLDGGGWVPAQVMLGVLAQESNLWQASGHAVEGVTGNPLVGNFYGLNHSRQGLDYFTIDWSRSDCGYGVAQVTDGMRRSDTSRTENQKRAIAVDYATNIAAGLRILQDKWNQTRRAGIVINNGDFRKPENWFAALWAYNTGMNPGPRTGNTTGCTPGPNCTDADGNWGLGYTNNPANASYPRNRTPFMENPDDARNPQRWPYSEKVLGWAAYPIIKTELSTGKWTPGFKQATWATDAYRAAVKPPIGLFCNAASHCDITRGGEPCMRADYHCWWHWPAKWKDCEQGECGYEHIAYQPGSPEPAGVENYRPNCSTDTLPANALIIDDVPDSVPSVRPGCGRPFSNAGQFSLRFNVDGNGKYRSKVDFHQIGGGFAGHFWFAHTRKPENDPYGLMRLDGTWTLNRELNGWARVMVHMPDHGAHTQQARYEVDLGNGTKKHRVLLQRTQRHEWVSLGAFRFAGVPKVTLSNETRDGDGREDIAWDAIAFQPLPDKPRHQVVAMGDSYSSGEGASLDARFDYYRETDDDGGKVKGPNPGDPGYEWLYGNACHRSRHAWSRQATMADQSRSVGERADHWDPEMDYQFIACSGAQTENLLPDGVKNTFGDVSKGGYRELSQFERGFLDDNTTLVTFSIGGNDARFGPVLNFCARVEHCPNLIMEGDSAPLSVTEPELILGNVQNSVAVVLRQIHQAAPKAKIVLMGYPRLFDGAPGRCMADELDQGEISWVHKMVDLLMDTYTDMAARLRNNEGIPVYVSDPRASFAGHGACAQPSEAEHIHAIVLDKTEGENPNSPVSMQTMHPKVSGAADYARAFVGTLRSIGM